MTSALIATAPLSCSIQASSSGDGFSRFPYHSILFCCMMACWMCGGCFSKQTEVLWTPTLRQVLQECLQGWTWQSFTRCCRPPHLAHHCLYFCSSEFSLFLPEEFVSVGVLGVIGLTWLVGSWLPGFRCGYFEHKSR